MPELRGRLWSVRVSEDRRLRALRWESPRLCRRLQVHCLQCRLDDSDGRRYPPDRHRDSHPSQDQSDIGSWAGGDATGAFIVTATTGTFTAGQAITVSGGYRAACNSSLIVSSQGDSSYTSDISLAREYYRGLIAKPTGEGAILGVKLMDGVVYCLRNVVGSATATLWKSTASGWSAVRTGLRPGGSLNASISSFSGASGRRLLFGADGKNRYWQYNPSTLAFTFGPAVYGSEGTSTTSVTPGSGRRSSL